MEFIFIYIKNICYFTIFVTLLLNIFPNKKYTNYIKMFAGFLMILIVIQPLVKFNDIEKLLDEMISKYTVNVKKENFLENINELETEIMERIIEQESVKDEGEN